VERSIKQIQGIWNFCIVVFRLLVVSQDNFEQENKNSDLVGAIT